ncbi:hypothetical protein PHYPSEUDO_003292 [Phytophthora pseudosyringae]|uniref:RxLR effector protein n=1 Tax=Phytophthora pseudosyringae TaxID=221518 RepID=A0A8T1VUV6_9STRA|nr:hypothetical protein PHYPSEUDO_003292 [Phytophthora pseudosyringae]
MRTFLLLVVAVVFAASCVSFTNAEYAVQAQSHLNTDRLLKPTADKEGDLIPADKEERAAGIAGIATRMKNLLRRNPSKMSEAKNNVKGANEAINKVNSVIGRGKTSTELTPAKMKTLETYARSNSENWWAMAYYITNVLGIGLSITFVYGVLFLGWIPYGMGGSPRAN